MKDYLYVGSKLVAEYQPASGKYYYYMSDQVNSTRMVTDDVGTVVHSVTYDPYGGPQKTWIKTYEPKLKFSGKEREIASELDYFGARYYDHIGYRFVSVDPIINKKEAFANPQLWNLYSYCDNNPITFVDPDGRTHASPMHNWYLNSAAYRKALGDELYESTTMDMGRKTIAAGEIALGVAALIAGATCDLGTIALNAGATLSGRGELALTSGLTISLSKLMQWIAMGLIADGSWKMSRNEQGGSSSKGKKRPSQESQEREFNEAQRQIEKDLGRELKKDERRRLHDSVTKQGFTKQEIIDEGKAMFSK